MSSLEPLGLGLDLGTSGLRLAVVNQQQQVLHEQALAYPGPFRDPHSWRQGFITLSAAIPEDLKFKVAAIAIDGTSEKIRHEGNSTRAPRQNQGKGYTFSRRNLRA